MDFVVYLGEKFIGKIFVVLLESNVDSCIFWVCVELFNCDGKLKLGMYV